MAHLSRRHLTLNQRLSVKDSLPHISYFSGCHPVKKKGCLFNLHLSGHTTLNPGHHSLIHSEKLQIRHGQRREAPCPTSIYPQHRRNISSLGIAGISPAFWLKHPHHAAPSGNWSLLFHHHIRSTLQNRRQVIS